MGIRKNLQGLKDLAAALSGTGTVQVGIFGRKSGRSEIGKLRRAGGHAVKKGSHATATNAEVGLLMELGSHSRNIPARSFLRMPITLHSKEIMKDAMAEIPNIWQKGGMLIFLKRVGIAAENVVQQAFASRGFGNWQPLKASTIARKGSDAPLIDTSQLRRAIASRASL